MATQWYASFCWGICIGSPLLYIVCYQIFKQKTVLNRLFTNPEAYKRFKYVYNDTVAFLSALIFVFNSLHFLNLWNQQRWSSIDEFYCGYDPMDQTTMYPALVTWVIFWLLKYVEWYDTLFLLKDGKRVSWLQYIHHALTPCIAVAPFMQPLGYFGPITNAFCHMFMYFYYNRSRALRSFKMLLTTVQILQHIFMMMHIATWMLFASCAYPFTHPHRLALWGGQEWSTWATVIYPTFGYSVFFIFFCNFFVQTYIMPKKAPAKTA